MKARDLAELSVSRLEERTGWLGGVQRDPGEDPPSMRGWHREPSLKEPR